MDAGSYFSKDVVRFSISFGFNRVLDLEVFAFYLVSFQCLIYFL